jgi:hypothetical protein
MPLAEAYRKQVALLIKIVPLVAAQPAFALKVEPQSTCFCAKCAGFPSRHGGALAAGAFSPALGRSVQ